MKNEALKSLIKYYLFNAEKNLEQKLVLNL